MILSCGCENSGGFHAMVTYVGVCADILSECGGDGTPYSGFVLFAEFERKEIDKNVIDANLNYIHLQVSVVLINSIDDGKDVPCSPRA